MGAFASFDLIGGRCERKAVVHGGDMGAGSDRDRICGCDRTGACIDSGTGSARFQSPEQRTDRIWGQLADSCAWYVDEASGIAEYALSGNASECGAGSSFSKKRTALSSVSDGSICDRRMDVKKKGRFVLEAAALVPGICLLIVHLCFFTLYAHDYAVCVHTALQAGVKGIYREEQSSRQIEENIKNDLRKKLEERLLWIQDPEIEVHVDPMRAEMKVSGKGSFWPQKEIVVQQNVYRIKASESVRRSRWLRE